MQTKKSSDSVSEKETQLSFSYTIIYVKNFLLSLLLGIQFRGFLYGKKEILLILWLPYTFLAHFFRLLQMNQSFLIEKRFCLDV